MRDSRTERGAGAAGRPRARSNGAETLDRRATAGLAAAGLATIAACYGLARFAYGLFLPAFRSEFSLDAAAAGAIAAGSYAAYCAAVVAATLLTPRVGARALAVLAGGLASAGVLLVALAPHPAVLALGVLVGGSSTGVASPPLAHAVAGSVREAARDRTQAVINAGTGVGVAVAGPVALLTHEHWRAAWLVFAAACAAAAVWAARAVPAGRPSARAAPPRLLPRPLLPAGAGRLLAAAAALGLSSAAVWTFGRDVLVGAGGMGAVPSTLVWVLLGAAGVLGAGAGDLGRRLGTGRAWAATLLTSGAATVALAAFPSSWAAAAASAAAFGAAYIAASGLLLLWGTGVYADAPATGVGAAFLVLALGQAAGAAIVGAVMQAAGPLGAFAAAGALAGGAALVRPARGRREA